MAHDSPSRIGGALASLKPKGKETVVGGLELVAQSGALGFFLALHVAGGDLRAGHSLVRTRLPADLNPPAARTQGLQKRSSFLATVPALPVPGRGQAGSVSGTSPRIGAVGRGGHGHSDAQPVQTAGEGAAGPSVMDGAGPVAGKAIYGARAHRYRFGPAK